MNQSSFVANAKRNVTRLLRQIRNNDREAVAWFLSHQLPGTSLAGKDVPGTVRRKHVLAALAREKGHADWNGMLAEDSGMRFVMPCLVTGAADFHETVEDWRDPVLMPFILLDWEKGQIRPGKIRVKTVGKAGEAGWDVPDERFLFRPMASETWAGVTLPKEVDARVFSGWFMKRFGAGLARCLASYRDDPAYVKGVIDEIADACRPDVGDIPVHGLSPLSPDALVMQPVETTGCWQPVFHAALPGYCGIVFPDDSDDELADRARKASEWLEKEGVAVPRVHDHFLGLRENHCETGGPGNAGRKDFGFLFCKMEDGRCELKVADTAGLADHGQRRLGTRVFWSGKDDHLRIIEGGKPAGTVPMGSPEDKRLLGSGLDRASDDGFVHVFPLPADRETATSLSLAESRMKRLYPDHADEIGYRFHHLACLFADVHAYPSSCLAIGLGDQGMGRETLLVSAEGFIRACAAFHKTGGAGCDAGDLFSWWAGGNMVFFDQDTPGLPDLAEGEWKLVPRGKAGHVMGASMASHGVHVEDGKAVPVGGGLFALKSQTQGFLSPPVRVQDIFDAWRAMAMRGVQGRLRSRHFTFV